MNITISLENYCYGGEAHKVTKTWKVDRKPTEAELELLFHKAFPGCPCTVSGHQAVHTQGSCMTGGTVRSVLYTEHEKTSTDELLDMAAPLLCELPKIMPDEDVDEMGILEGMFHAFEKANGHLESQGD